MPKTDTKINYSLRPQKAIERKLFVHLFRHINSVFPLDNHRYIGMGAKYFVDFLQFHKEFNFSQMISIEADSENKEKYDFNNPLKCIVMKYGYTSEVLHTIDWTKESHDIIWLDYDEQLKRYMLDDLGTIIQKMNSKSMFFISFNCTQYGSPKSRLETYKKNLELYAIPDAMPMLFADSRKNSTLKQTVDNVINEHVQLRKRAFPNHNIDYVQLCYYWYKDGAEMLTIGGILLNESDRMTLETSSVFDLDYVITDTNSAPFELLIPHLTGKEIHAVMQCLPCDNPDAIDVPGLTREDKSQIHRLYRYYPSYFEATAFN